MKKRTKRQQAIIKRRIFVGLTAFVLCILVGLVAFLTVSVLSPDKKPAKGKNPQGSANSQNAEKDETYVTVLSTGDIMVHQKQLDGAYDKTDKKYDFSLFFKEISPLLKKADLSVGNLEVSLGGTEGGAYRGYPSFNTPDSIVDAIKNAGFNFLTTANNHMYDTGLKGLIRTAKVLKEKGIAFVGTRENENDKLYKVQNVGGIKIGMTSYTYGVNGGDASSISNINSFSSSNLQKFYQSAEENIAKMKENGAEFIVFYMHWGSEYQTSANTVQKTIAQKLSNLGVDIIIGSHPHVIQPIDIIYSEDGQNTTVCAYSLGNAVSNQRVEELGNQGHTEDGMLFYYTLCKKGKEVTLESVDVIPTWVDRYDGENGYSYTVYPLIKDELSKDKYGLGKDAIDSYKRTEAILKESLTKVQKELGCEITFK